MPFQLIEELIELNKAQSELFSDSDSHDEREEYRKDHLTEIGAFKCMDGRLHLPVMTETPLGIIQPWRNMGGVFDLGWPFFGESVHRWVEYAKSRRRKNLALLTYHFSKGDPHRGCAGFKYDTEAARSFTRKLKTQFERVYGSRHFQVYPICIGIETDFDGFLLHGTGEKNLLDLEDVPGGIRATELRVELRKLYPDMDEVILNDLLVLVLGNVRHIEKIRKAKRPIVAMEHRERILAIGQGFDWLHRPNFALIVGPFSPNLSDPIAVAASIIKDNIAYDRVPQTGFVLLSSAPYRVSVGEERRTAIERSGFYIDLALQVIKERVPELVKLAHPLRTVIDLNTRKFEIIK